MIIILIWFKNIYIDTDYYLQNNEFRSFILRKIQECVLLKITHGKKAICVRRG